MSRYGGYKTNQLESNAGLKVLNDVIVLNDVYFLYQKDRAQKQFQVMMGEERLPSESIDNFNSNINFNNSLARKYGFRYQHIIFPAKPTLYREQFKNIGIELKSIFSNKHSKENVYYPDLSTVDYFLQDTHINIIGTIKLLRGVLNHLHYGKLPKELLSHSYKIGDLGHMANINTHEKVSILKGFEGIPVPNVESYSLDTYLENTNGQMSFKFNTNALFNERLVLFGTRSFNTRLEVYQSLFSEVIFIRCPYILEEIVSVLEPDIVLSSNAERHLFNVPIYKESTPWFLNYISPNFDSKSIPRDDWLAFRALFSGRESTQYKERFGKRLSHLPRELNNLEKITISDISSTADVFFLRDMAISLEKSNLDLAIYFMSLAHEARPEGKLIKSKLDRYKNMGSLLKTV